MSDKFREPAFRGASRAQLEELHKKLADAMEQHFVECAANGETPTAWFMAVVRSFLNDNQVVTDAAAAADLRSSLSQLRSLSLPFVDPKTKQ